MRMYKQDLDPDAYVSRLSGTISYDVLTHIEVRIREAQIQLEYRRGGSEGLEACVIE